MKNEERGRDVRKEGFGKTLQKVHDQVAVIFKNRQVRRGLFPDGKCKGLVFEQCLRKIVTQEKSPFSIVQAAQRPLAMK